MTDQTAYRVISDVCRRSNTIIDLKRRFSDKVAKALAENGVETPEAVLFMPQNELKGMNGIGPSALKELNAYRAQYLQ